MADNFRCPIKGDQFKRDYELVQADNKRNGITMTADYRAFIAQKAAKVRREAK